MIYKELVRDYIRQNRLLISFFIIVTLLTFPVESILIPELYGRLYTGVGSRRTPEGVKRIGKLIMVIIGVWLVIQLFYFLKNRLNSKILPKYLEFTRKKLFVKIIENYETNYKDIEISKTIARIFELTRDMKDFFYFVSDILLPLLLTVILVVLYLAYMDWKIGLAAFLSLFVFFLVGGIIGKKIVDLSAIREGVYLEMTESIHDSFDNLMNIYLNNQKNSEVSKTQKIQEKHTALYQQQLRLVSAMSLSTSMISVAIFAIIIGLAFWNYKTGVFGSMKFITVTLVIIYFMGFLINMSTWTPAELLRLGIIKNSSEFLAEILQSKNFEYVKNPNLDGGIVFNKITYSYGEGKPIFTDFSFSVEKGKKVAILGPSGSGKTTLMKLLLGLHRVSKGGILINGIEISKINPEDLRSQVNYINQRTGLFTGSVLQNMKYGNKISDEKLVALLKKYGLDENFKRLKDGLYSNAGVQGKGMSGGMQKIIMNVRGILRNGKIVVFDEPLAGLDASTRIKMIKMIEEVCRGKTMLVITHDKEILDIMDKVVNLRKISS